MMLLYMLLKAVFEHSSVAVRTKARLLLDMLQDVRGQLSSGGIGLIAGFADVINAIAAPVLVLVEFACRVEVSKRADGTLQVLHYS